MVNGLGNGFVLFTEVFERQMNTVEARMKSGYTLYFGGVANVRHPSQSFGKSRICFFSNLDHVLGNELGDEHSICDEITKLLKALSQVSKFLVKSCVGW